MQQIYMEWILQQTHENTVAGFDNRGGQDNPPTGIRIKLNKIDRAYVKNCIQQNQLN